MPDAKMRAIQVQNTSVVLKQTLAQASNCWVSLWLRQPIVLALELVAYGLSQEPCVWYPSCDDEQA
jgi:hypothetical protein